MLASSGCAVRRTSRVPASQTPPPVLEASATDLVDRLNAQGENIRTLTAKVDFAPSAGSVYSGVIKEYRDVRGFILVKRPALIRILGQAPVVRTSIFDMVSDGREFRLYIPPKQKFIVGKTEFTRPAKNALENMRPQHIMDALFVPALDTAHERFAFEESEEGNRLFYVVTVFAPPGGQELLPQRKVWFDRTSLDVARLQIYGPHGVYLEDVQYSDYENFEGIRYPTRIEIRRPVEDYRLGITIQEAKFNQPIAPEKFELKKPENAQLVELSARAEAEGSHGK